MAVSDRQSSEVGEAGRPSQVVGEPPELGVEWGVVCPDLATLLFVEGADLKKMFVGLFFRASLALCCICEPHLSLSLSLFLSLLDHDVLCGRRKMVVCSRRSNLLLRSWYGQEP